MKRFLAFLRLFVSLGLIPMWFVNLFHGVGHLPSPDGTVVRVDFYHSMFENISDLGLLWLCYLSFSVCVLSAGVAGAGIARPEKNLCRASWLSFTAAVLLFLISLLLASTVARGY